MVASYRSGSVVALALLIGADFSFAQNAKPPRVLPAVCEEGRFYATPTTADGQKLRFLTDSGGGLFITKEAAKRVKLPMVDQVFEGEKVKGVKLPAWRSEETGIPPVGQPGLVPVLDPAALGKKNALYQHIDGLLGANWFAQRVWTFDYPGGRLLLRAPGDIPAHEASQKVPLYFQKNPANGEKTSHFPRIIVRADGQEIAFLFDTGASTELTEAARAQLHDGRPALRATSFITASVFNRWHEHHPDWPVIENADEGSGQAMIKVPQLEVAGRTVGPAWFTRRPDKNFHEWMSQWMDKKIEGAVGGNVWGHFRVTVSYPDELAIFEEPAR